jgi:hypothetical protein
MSKKITINTHLPSIPSWLKIDNTIAFPLPLKKAKELAKKLSDVDEDVEVVLNLSSGKEVKVEVKYESQKGATPEGITKTDGETPEEG